MPLTGDIQAIRGLSKRLEKMKAAAQEIARALSPKIAPLVQETFASQSSPEGAAWPPTKSGAPAFAGSSAAYRVLSRVVGKATVRTTVLYPLHFHQDGTHKVGRKRGRSIASKVMGGYVKSVLKQMGLAGSAPRQRKGESDEAYAKRVAKFEAAKTARKDAKLHAKAHAKQAVEEARTAGGWHDPPRPMIPDEGDDIPASWLATIKTAARDVMAKYGAEERG